MFVQFSFYLTCSKLKSCVFLRHTSQIKNHAVFNIINIKNLTIICTHFVPNYEFIGAYPLLSSDLDLNFYIFRSYGIIFSLTGTFV